MRIPMDSFVFLAIPCIITVIHKSVLLNATRHREGGIAGTWILAMRSEGERYYKDVIA